MLFLPTTYEKASRHKFCLRKSPGGDSKTVQEAKTKNPDEN
jgi:hypothetical protein